MEKQQQVEKLLGDILALMQFPARLDFKDAADGSLAVAMHFVGEVPQGITAGKKSYLVDSLQFLLNKCINRPNTERRWVTLGVGGFPEPRGSRPQNGAAPSAPGAGTGSVPASASVAASGSAPASAPRGSGLSAPRGSGPSAPRGSAPSALAAGSGRPARPPPPARVDGRGAPQRPARAPEVDESKLEVAADPALSALGKSLAEKSARLGRVYAVAMMSIEDRARLLQAARQIKGVVARVEGESHFRRLAFMPEKPTAMPKRHAMAVYPDDEEEGD